MTKKNIIKNRGSDTLLDLIQEGSIWEFGGCTKNRDSDRNRDRDRDRDNSDIVGEIPSTEEDDVLFDTIDMEEKDFRINP